MMKKFFVSVLAIALISMFSVVAFGQPAGKRKTNQTATPTATPRVKKPVNNSTDSVADYNRPNRQTNSAARQNKAADRQTNQQEKQAQRQAQQQEKQAQRQAQQEERKAQREAKTAERAEQRQNATGNRRANNNAQSPNSANAPTPPCSQLQGGDWLYKGKKCLDANGNVTTVGAYQQSQGTNGSTSKTPNAGGNRRANRQNQNGNKNLPDGAITNDGRYYLGDYPDGVKPNSTNETPAAKGQGRRGGRLNRNNPPANPEEPNATTGDGQRRPPSAQNGRTPNIPGASVKSADPNANVNSTPPNIPGATVTPSSNSNLPNIPGATVTPNKPGTTLPNSPGNQAQTTPSNTNPTAPSNAPDSDLVRFGFDYPDRPEEIVTWNQNSGPYGYTTVKDGWEFILTSNIGVAIRKFGRERTVVAHTKCNDPDNYEFGYGGSGGRIDMIMCKPKREGLPRLRPSIMIVPRDRYFDDQR